MTASLKELAKDIAQLPRDQRLALARVLLDLDPPGSANDAEQLWDEEIRSRIKAIDEGRAIGMSYEDLKREMTARLASR